MRLLHLTVIVTFALLSACDSSSDSPAASPSVPGAVAPGTAQAPPPPAEPEPDPDPPQDYAFPKHANAFVELKALEYIPPTASFVAATPNPTQLFEVLGADPPEAAELDPRHPPELLDLHPARMQAAGLDAQKPAGIAIFGDGDPTSSESWVIFAKLADERAFRDAFNVKAADKRGILAPKDPVDQRRYLKLSNDEILISQKVELVEPAKSLAVDDDFQTLAEAVDYGNLGTVYVHLHRGSAMFGVGHGPEGLGMKAFAEDEMFAATLRLSFWEFGATANPRVAAHLRVINPRAERHPQGMQLRQQLDELENTPIRRRLAESKNLGNKLEVVGSLETSQAGFKVAGRMWRVDADGVGAGFREWAALGLSEEELQQKSDLEESLRTMSFVSKGDAAAMTDLLATETMQMGDGAAQVGDMLGMGGLLGGGGGGDQKSKGKGGAPQGGGAAGMLGNLGGLGGFLGGGGGDDDYKSDVRSADPELRDLVRKRMSSVALCYARHMDNKPLNATVGLKVREGGAVSVTSASGGNEKFRECMKQGLSLPGGGAPKEGTVRISIAKK